MLDDNAKLAALIGPASAAVIDGEKKISKDFTTEVEARQAVIDELWLGKKAVEMTFKRDRGLVKLIFFDFSKDGSSGEGQPLGGGGEGGEDGGGEGAAGDAKPDGTGGTEDPKPA